MDQAARSGPILIAADDKKTAAVVALCLEQEGFKTVAAYDGLQAIDLTRSLNPIFVILDPMLPKVCGWDVCQELRRFSDVPILILTERNEEFARIFRLAFAADLFRPRELVERVETMLRRTRPTSLGLNGLFAYAGLVLDCERRRVTLNGQRVAVTPTEYKLLQTLMAAPGRVFTREQLLDHLYPGGEAVIDRVIDVHVGNLRQKIEYDPSKPRYIMTERGIGYVFAEG